MIEVFYITGFNCICELRGKIQKENDERYKKGVK